MGWEVSSSLATKELVSVFSQISNMCDRMAQGGGSMLIACFPNYIYAKTMYRSYIELSLTVHSIECPKALGCGVRWIRMTEVEITEFEHDLQVP